jgi:hypothetical protein
VAVLLAPSRFGSADVLSTEGLGPTDSLRLVVFALPLRLECVIPLEPSTFLDIAAKAPSFYRVETNDSLTITDVLAALRSERLTPVQLLHPLDVRLYVRISAGETAVREYFFDASGRVAAPTGLYRPTDGDRWLTALWQAIGGAHYYSPALPEKGPASRR